MIAPKRIHRQPQHQRPQQEQTFQQAQLRLVDFVTVERLTELYRHVPTGFRRKNWNAGWMAESCHQT